MVRNNLIHGANRDALQLEGARARTVPSIITAKCDRNNNTLAVNVSNDGATSVAFSDFVDIDIVVFCDSAAQDPADVHHHQSSARWKMDQHSLIRRLRA